MAKLRTLIVDDEPFARERIRHLLEGEVDIEVVGECEDGMTALDLLRERELDLVFLDVQMPELDGFGLLGRLDVAKPIFLAGKPRRLLFEFEGASFRTHPDDLAYLCQLIGHEPGERVVYEGQLAYNNLPDGDYEFRVRAVDQDLNVSPVAAIPVVISPDYAHLALAGGLGVAMLGRYNGIKMGKEGEMRRE